MEGTPRIKKRRSLTLGRHIKRHAQTGSNVITTNNHNLDDHQFRVHKSPSINSIRFDDSAECTPPPKKLNLDDSIDYSPKCFDTSFSPNLLSQTFSSNSPEVGWKWGRRSVDEQIEISVTTPDSAYAADGSLISVASNSTEVINSIGRVSQTQRFVYEMRREEQRRKLEVQMRRAEKLRADELLKQRCARLEEQLRESDKRRRKDTEPKTQSDKQTKSQDTSPKPKVQTSLTADIADLAAIDDIFATAKDSLEDFFNDSDSDGLLLKATQEVESKIVELTHKSTAKSLVSEIYSNALPLDANNFVSGSPKHTKAKPATEQRQKRSSLYLKLLEDDSPDDWFLSLDDVILQATQQTNKPRNSFQRHNSMPTNTSTTLYTDSAGTSKSTTTTATALSSHRTTSTNIQSITSINKSVSSSKMKRHASSNALSPPPGTSYSYCNRHPY